jgi:hypothetical protein
MALGMSLNDPANLVYLAGHRGRHLEAYHTEVYRRLEAALEDCGDAPRCKIRLIDELRNISTWGWRVALIISEDLKAAMETAGLSGTRFVEV